MKLDAANSIASPCLATFSHGNFFLVPGVANASSFDLDCDHGRCTCLGRIVATMWRSMIVALDPSAGSGGFSRHIAWLDRSTSFKDCCFLHSMRLDSPGSRTILT